MKKFKGGRGGSPYTAHKHVKKVRRNFIPPGAAGNARTARQLFRYEDLKGEYFRNANALTGRTALVVLPGHGCAHSTDQFRPVHWEPQWRSRPFFVLLSAEKNGSQHRLTLAGATSKFDDSAGLLRYANGMGDQPCQYDFTKEPRAGAFGDVLDGAQHHVLFTAGNNCLQALVDSDDQTLQSLVLPRLLCLIEGSHMPIDQKKLDAVCAAIPEDLRAQYRQRRIEEAIVVSLGTKFADASLMPDKEIRKAFREKRCYEDYSELLGADMPNPVRKVLMVKNPARTVLAAAGMGAGWDVTASQETMEMLLTQMRTRLPLPELASDNDLLDALAEPDRPIRFSRQFSDIVKAEPAAVCRAMRNTFPLGASVRDYVKDDELLAAARNPENPLRVSAYARIQVVKSADLGNLPPFATGTFWPDPEAWATWVANRVEVRQQAPVWEEPENEVANVDLEPGDVSDVEVPCAQLTRENIAE